MTQPKYSKKAVDKAGDTLISVNATPDDKEAAREILDYWRELHSGLIVQPSGIHTDLLYEIQCSTRIKRSESITKKLERISGMKLSRMQDIAGIRFVLSVSDPNKQYELLLLLKKQSDYLKLGNVGLNFIFKGENDYIQEPKDSGYRAIHQIYRHEDSQSPQNGLLLELQLRTRLQHLWAMAVETVGMFYGQALKSNEGDKEWLDFFKLVSAAFSHLEKSPVVAEHAERSFEEIRTLLKKAGTEKSFFTKLKAIKELKSASEETEYDYWLLELNVKKETNRIYGFKKEQLETAHEMYSAKERTAACLRGDVYVVLVSTECYQDLRMAYPSFFLDITEFMNVLTQLKTI